MAQNFVYTVSLDTFIVDITQLDSCSQMELSLLILYRQRINY